MTTATVAAPSGNAYAVLLALFTVTMFVTFAVLWMHEKRWDRHGDLLHEHAEQLATLAGRIQSLADFLDVEISDPVDDSPEAMAMVEDETPTEEIPVAPPTVPDGMPLAVQSALIERPQGADWVEQELEALRARNTERMARRVQITKEAS